MSFLRNAEKLFNNVYLFTWDTFIALANLIAPNRKPGSVIPHGQPGAGRKWPEFVPPGKGDSRCCCPALNALANHGILPRDGRNIKFTEMTHAVKATFNLSSTFSIFVPTYAADMLHKNYKTDSFDLADLNVHNGIEHDGSLLREDARFDPKQDTPNLPLITELLASSTGKAPAGDLCFTHADLSRASGKRRGAARATNPDFTLNKSQKGFASGNCASLLLVFGGRVAELEPFLTEERLPEGFEPHILSRWGLSLLVFNLNIFKIERAIKEEAVPVAAMVQNETA
ncbi:Cloroperoxidase [Mycena metata]|uniref:Cloroperoxidase n=1 Tax=Mycena metata TaxID=1033252 RepID=A0AAD7N5U8_9AGAR|nr:Cloroperoxidase [Mycena metata]KAJ7747856.1 Cloroperoxidase [Mycena metata]